MMSQALSHTLTFDVSGRIGIPGTDASGTLPIVAHCFPPRWTSPYLPHLWTYLIHGGSYDWHYWHLEVPGHPSDAYSFAQFLARHGIGVIAIDCPGCGESRWACSGGEITLERIAHANSLAIQQARQLLESGDLIPGLAAVQDARVVVIGHSMGGAIATTLAALYPDCCEALAVMGWTNQPGQMPGVDEEALVPYLTPDPDGYLRLPKKLMREAFFLEDVPEDVIRADERWDSPMPSATVLSLFTPRRTAPFAREVRMPVLMLFGERDATASPEQEPETFPRAPRRDLYIVEGSAHCHLISQKRMEAELIVLHWLWSELAGGV